MIRTVTILAALSALTGCGDPNAKNPVYFKAGYKMGVISGQYNPKGWTSAEIQKIIVGPSCKKTLFSYFENRLQNGLMEFHANCSSDGHNGTGLIAIPQKTL